MAAPFRTLCCTALRHSSRCFTTTCGAQAGIKWRTENGLARSGTEYGPLTDFPDWSFAGKFTIGAFILMYCRNIMYGRSMELVDAVCVVCVFCLYTLCSCGFWGYDLCVCFLHTDGRSAPPLKGQLRRKQERETLARRIVSLSSEVDKGMEVWREKREEAKRMAERNKSLLLKPKGNLLLKKNK
uniref:Large ribosomal subunit protein mL52 n=1 Tax=Salmo trutta TaxID=8032 RepID=A0A674AD45_SALTR